MYSVCFCSFLHFVFFGLDPIYPKYCPALLSRVHLYVLSVCCFQILSVFEMSNLQ
uniref:Uncharacterized protein n=1 Tax=Rhizophora mucronata TaxID=61149 RepID=A0A2P2QAN7_RHIMU